MLKFPSPLDGFRSPFGVKQGSTGFTPDAIFADGTQGGWYDATDISTLYQDTAGATPVTATGQEVRLIKAKNGNTGYDLIIHDTALPAVYQTRGGVGCVDFNGVAGFSSRADVVLSVPTFMAAAIEWTQLNKTFFGIQLNTVAYLALQSPTSTQNRPRVITNGTGIGGAAPGFNPWDGQYANSPQLAPQVLHAQFSVGTHDVAINELPITSEANAWNGAETANTRLRVGMASHTAEADIVGRFFGGLMFKGVMDSETRQQVAAYFKSKCERPLAATDRNILILGDSTGDNHEDYTGSGGLAPVGGDWPFRLAKQIAADNATAWVDIRRYENLYGYGAPEVLGTGTASAIRVWNGSVAGSQPNQALASNFAKQIRDVPLCDTVIINHGYNIEASAGMSVAAYDAQYMALIEAVKAAHPGAHLILTRQPRKETGSTTNMDALATAVDNLAALYGASKFDIHDAFIDDGVADKWSDGLHFNTYGVDVAVARVITEYAALLPLAQHGPGFLEDRTTNHLLNGRFYDWTAGSPDNWTQTGAGTVSQVVGDDATLPDNTVAVQIDDTSAQATNISQIVNAVTPVDLRGQTVILGVRMFLPTGLSTVLLSRIELVTNGTGGATTVAVISPKWTGGWQWFFNRCVVPADATTITAKLHCRVSGAADMTIRYCEAFLAAGSVPRRGV